MYADYLKEREGTDVLETTEGFCTYRIKGQECYIEDIYVKPEHRRGHSASRMADKVAEIAKASGCAILSGSVSPSANGSHASLLTLIGYNMQLHSCKDNIIYFVKEIN